MWWGAFGGPGLFVRQGFSGCRFALRVRTVRIHDSGVL